MSQNYDEWMKIADAERRGSSGHDGDGCLAVFYTRPVEDKKATELEGRPIFTAVPFVKIHIPGDKNSVVDERVKDEHKRRWPAAWAAYEAKQEGSVDGTPIEQFPLLTVTQVATLRHIGVLTVEQLAHVSDANLRNLGPGGDKLRDRAGQYLKGPAETEKILRERIVSLETTVGDLTAKLQQLMGALEPREDHDEMIARGVDAAFSQMAPGLEDEPKPAQRRGPGRPPRRAAA